LIRKKNIVLIFNIVKMDSRTRSSCLGHYVQKGISFLGRETWLTLCINDPKRLDSVIDLRQNKYELFHRITSIKTPLIYNIKLMIEISILLKVAISQGLICFWSDQVVHRQLTTFLWIFTINTLVSTEVLKTI